MIERQKKNNNHGLFGQNLPPYEVERLRWLMDRGELEFDITSADAPLQSYYYYVLLSQPDVKITPKGTRRCFLFVTAPDNTKLAYGTFMLVLLMLNKMVGEKLTMKALKKRLIEEGLFLRMDFRRYRTRQLYYYVELYRKHIYGRDTHTGTDNRTDISYSS